MSITEIVKGDSSKVYKVRIKDAIGAIHNISDSNWTGTIVVRQTLDGSDIVNNALIKGEDDKTFFGQLSPTDTEGLSSNTEYFLTIQIVNMALTFPFRKENQRRIKILPEGA